MQAIKLRAVLGEDHRLELQVPPEIPVGDVEVIVLTADLPSVRGGQELQDVLDKIDRLPRKRLTKEDIDRYIAGERAGWD